MALFVGLLAAYGTGHWLRHAGASRLVEFAGWLGTFLAVSLALLALVVQLRPKKKSSTSLTQGR